MSKLLSQSRMINPANGIITSLTKSDHTDFMNCFSVPTLDHLFHCVLDAEGKSLGTPLQSCQVLLAYLNSDILYTLFFLNHTPETKPLRPTSFLSCLVFSWHTPEA